MQSFVKTVNNMNWLLVRAIGVLVCIMSMFIIIQVFCRYVLNNSLPWTEELARYIMIWTTFLGAAVALRRGGLIAMEVVVQFTPKKISNILVFLAYILSIVFFVLYIVIGFQMVEVSGQETTPVLKLPMECVYASMPVGGVLLLINAVAGMIERYLLKEA